MKTAASAFVIGILLVPAFSGGPIQSGTSMGPSQLAGFIDSNPSMFFRSVVTGNGTITLEVEVKPLGTAFDTTGTNTSPGVATGATAEVAVTLPGTPQTQAYHWQARVTDADGSTAWQSFGGHLETDADFTIDLTPPIPFGLQQSTNTPGFVSVPAGTVDSNVSLQVRGSFIDADFDGTVFEAEVQVTGVAYTGTPTATSPTYFGSGTHTFSLTMPTTPQIQNYKWRLRMRQSVTLYASAWVEFAGNPPENADFTIDLTPPLAFGLLQSMNTPGFVSVPAGTIDSNVNLQLRGSFTDADFDGTVFEVEVQVTGVAYTGTPTATSPTYFGSGTHTFSVTMPTTPQIQNYKWRLRMRQVVTLYVSAWVEFAGNPPENADFTIDLTPPLPATLEQAATSGGPSLPVGTVLVGGDLYPRATVTDPDGDTYQLEVEIAVVPTFPGTLTAMSAVSPSGSAIQAVFLGLPNGTYHWRVRSVNALGYQSAWVSFGGNLETETDFIVNVSPPSDPTGLEQAAAAAGAAELAGFSDADGTVFFRATVTNGGAPVKLEVEIKPVWVAFDGTVTASSAFVASGTVAETSATILGDGAFHWRARATGSSLSSGWVSFGGNPEADADFYRDTLEPDSTVTTTGILSPATYVGSIQGTASDVTTGPVSTGLQIQRASDSMYWDGATWGAAPVFVPATGTLTWTYAFAPTDGETYTISSRALDGAGNFETTFGTNTFTFDATEPDSVVTTTGAQTSATWTGTIDGTASDTTSGIATVKITIFWVETSQYWNGTTWQVAPVLLTATGGAAWSFPFAPQTNQSYDVTSVATDGAGNVEATAGMNTFTYNVSGPDSAVLTTGAFGPLTWTGSIAGTATTTGGAIVTQVDIRIQRASDGFYWDGLGWGAGAFVAVTGTTSWTYAFTPVDGETYTVESRATDDFMNVEATFGTSTFTYGATPPVTVITTSGLYTLATWSGSVQGTSSGGTGGVVLVEVQLQRVSDGLWWDGAAWVAAPAWAPATGTAVWVLTLAAAEGDVYTIQARSTDAASIVSAVVSSAFAIGAPNVSAQDTRRHFRCSAGVTPGAPWMVVLGVLALASTARRRSTRSR